MTSSSALPRNLIIFGVLAPVAILVGYLLATPTETLSFAGVGMVILIGLLPLLLRWHHSMLIVTWNMAITVFFLPGQPNLWMLFAIGSVGISFVDWLLTKKESFLNVPSLTWSLIALALVTIGTARLTGGIGIRSLGADTYGGKQYVIILFAIIGFFALVSKKIELSKAKLMVGLFFLSGITPVVSNLAYFGGPGFYFLYWIFPVGYAFQQAAADWSVGSEVFARLAGFSSAGMAFIVFLLQRYGLTGLLQISKVWRGLLFVSLLFVTLLGGYRSSVVILATAVAGMFILEKLYRTRIMVATMALGIVFAALLVTTATKLPLAIQRSLSILPIEVDPIAKFDADVTTEWRLRMWSYLLPEVPKYLLKPKGYSLDPTELYLVTEGVKRGINTDIEATMVSGAYHSGPLTLVLGLGIWGVLAFGWFVIASFKVLYRNYRYGPPDLRTINALLFAYFLARVVYFIAVFGHFAEDLFIFTGIVGLSVSVNGGVRQQAVSPQPSSAPLELAEALPNPAS